MPTIEEVDRRACPSGPDAPSSPSRIARRPDQPQLPGRRRRHAVLRPRSPARRRTCSPSIAPTRLHNTRAAARRRRRARGVVHHAPGAGTSSSSSGCPAETMSNAGLAEPRDARADRRRAAPPPCRARGSALDFDMFRLAEQYLRVIDESGDRSRTATATASRLVPRIEAALARPAAADASPATTTCWPRTTSTTGGRLWIVDYEYSGNNDPTFELGNTCQELGFDDDADRRDLCAAYFGEATPARLARMRLQMIMSRRRLDALGGHPGPGLDDRLRLLGLGASSAGRARRRRSTAPTFGTLARRTTADARPSAERRPAFSRASASRPDRARTSAATTAGTRASKTSTSRAAPSATPAAGRPSRPSARRV